MSVMSLVAAGLLALLLLWGVSAYNRLVRFRNTIVNAFAQIDVQLKRRYDLIPNLVEVARKYIAHERETLEAVISARSQARTASEAARARPTDARAMGALGAAEQTLGGSLGRLLAVAENYPDLKADQTLRELSEELTSTENKVSFARQAYNDAVLEYNNAGAQFPDFVVARVFGFAPSAVLQATAGEDERKTLRIEL